MSTKSVCVMELLVNGSRSNGAQIVLGADCNGRQNPHFHSHALRANV